MTTPTRAGPDGDARDDARGGISVVVPTYNGAASLPELCDRLAAVLERSGSRWEVIVVDDASPDATPAAMREVQARHARIRYHRLATNVGQHRATVHGLALASGAVVVTIDDDLQQAPESIPALIAALEPAAWVAVARFARPAHPWWRRLGSRLVARRLTSARGPARAAAVPPAFAITSFKAFRREALERLLPAVPSGPFYLGRVMLAVLPAERLVNVDLPHHPRRHGRSNYGLRRLLALGWSAARPRRSA